VIHRPLCALSVAIGLALSACTSSLPANCRTNERLDIVDSLYFGGAYPDGVISSEQWQQFVDRVVTPRFPEGLTVWQAAGQYRTNAGVIEREPSWILQLIHPDNAQSETAIREIRSAYQAEYKQESVLRVRSKACIAFQ
jgi:hypothetical protein